MISRAMSATEEQLVANTTASIQMHGPIWIVNTTTSRRTVRLHHVVSGASAQAGNALLYDAAIAPNSSMMLEIPIMLQPGDQLRGKADADGVTAVIYGDNRI